MTDEGRRPRGDSIQPENTFYSLVIYFIYYIQMPKSKSSVMKAFRVRVDCEGDARMTTFCEEVSDRFILVHHTTTTENPHYHIYIETHYSQGNFSNKIKSQLGVSGGDYSNKSCDTDRHLEYLSYLFNTKKGNIPRLVQYRGFSPIDVATYQENAKLVEREFQTKMKLMKKTQYDIVQIVLERMNPDQTCYPELIYDTLVSVLKETRCMARPYHVKDMIASVMAFSDNRHANSKIKELTLKFFSPNNT